MINPFSNFNLQMLNLWIGLCRGEAGLPNDMRKLGYKDKWIELEFPNSQGQNVKPELIISSDNVAHTVLFEWKEGANTDADQLNRYAGVVSSDLVTKASLDRNEATAHDVCILGLIENKQRLQVGITKGNHPFPLLIVCADGISLEYNCFKKQNLSNAFTPKLNVNFSMLPTQIVPFDHNSQHWEIAEHIVPQIIEYMSRGEPCFTLDQIAQDCVPVWAAVMAPGYKKMLETKMTQVIDAAVKHEFHYYIKRDREAARRVKGPIWKIVYNPNSLQYDKRSREYKKLAKLQEQFITALRTGNHQPVQLHMDIT